MAPPMKRRRFVRTLALAAGAGALGGAGAALSGCGGVNVHRVELTRGRLSIPASRFASLAGDEGALALATAERTHPVLLMREPGGRFRALSSRCTHQGCAVRLVRELLVCPCHGSTYTREGQVVRGPAPRALDTFPVRVADGWIHVEVSDVR